MVWNASVSECHCLALPADIKFVHWSKLRGTRSGAYANSKPVTCIHIPVQNILTQYERRYIWAEGKLFLVLNAQWGWLGRGRLCAEGNLSDLQRGELFLAGPFSWLPGTGVMVAVCCTVWSWLFRGWLSISWIHWPLPLLLFKGLLTFGDVAAQLIPKSRRNEKRIKVL